MPMRGMASDAPFYLYYTLWTSKGRRQKIKINSPIKIQIIVFHSNEYENFRFLLYVFFSLYSPNDDQFHLKKNDRSLSLYPQVLWNKYYKLEYICGPSNTKRIPYVRV